MNGQIKQHISNHQPDPTRQLKPSMVGFQANVLSVDVHTEALGFVYPHFQFILCIQIFFHFKIYNAFRIPRTQRDPVFFWVNPLIRVLLNQWCNEEVEDFQSKSWICFWKTTVFTMMVLQIRESLFMRIFFQILRGFFFRIWFLMDFPPNTRHPDKGTSITESHISTLKHCLLVTGGFKVEMAISTWYPQSKSFFKL